MSLFASFAYILFHNIGGIELSLSIYLYINFVFIKEMNRERLLCLKGNDSILTLMFYI